MSNPNPDRYERVRQIREQLQEAQRPQRYPPRAGWEDIEYLLSLLDNQATGGDYSKLAHEIVSEYNSADDPGLLRRKVAEGFATVASDAATCMKDRCVAKLIELIDAEQKKHPSAHVAVRRMALHDAITAIQALTLEGEPEK